MGKKSRTKEVWTKLFGFQVGDNVLLTREGWRKKRYGIIVYRNRDLVYTDETRPTYLIHFGEKRAKKREWEYKSAGIFCERQLELDEIQRVKTSEERDKEREEISKSR